MLTPDTQAVIALAKDRAFAHTLDRLDLESLVCALCADSEASLLLAELLTKADLEALLALAPPLGQPAPCPGLMEPDEDLLALLRDAAEMASGRGVPDRSRPGLVSKRHLACAVAVNPLACACLGLDRPLSHEEALRRLKQWRDMAASAPSLSGLVARLRDLRADLLGAIFGQDHAVHTFIEGLYSAEVSAAADHGRIQPAAVFVFAGPPGVGKSLLASRAAAFLGRPYKRFDMSGYSDHQAHNQLVGFAQAYKGAQPGQLTEFVAKNPSAILLFDEIEKAHLNAIQLFYQVLDAGVLEDKFSEENVGFRGTIIIFTTNAGRSLYDNPNRAGISATNSRYHKLTLLTALAAEANPANGQPAFPPAICSRLSQGYPILFNHLGVNELEKVCAAELRRVEGLLQRQHLKVVSHDPLLPMLLVYREGGRVDARQVAAACDSFIKGELFKFCSLYHHDRLEEALAGIDRVRFVVDERTVPAQDGQRDLFLSEEAPTVLLVANRDFADLCRARLPEINWLTAASPAEVRAALAGTEPAFALLDIWLRPQAEDEASLLLPGQTLLGGQDYVSLASRDLDEGRRVLAAIRRDWPGLPVYLLSFERNDGDSSSAGDQGGRRPVDEELFMACVRSGGARGLVAASPPALGLPDPERDRLAGELLAIGQGLYREEVARGLARERHVVGFDTVARVDRQRRELCIRARNLGLSRALEAGDAGELMEDVERPRTTFADVVGAGPAKEALGFVVDWLRDPRRYRSLGVRPPRGILLYGPPGTGKTMLARALAGQSNCSFIEKSSTSFVTVWQGSGPQNVRDLFARARRYAPAVIFIDEIDAIGLRRGGSAAASRAEEETLNTLLMEMDGFRAGPQPPVIVLAATNLADALDPALRRRFDREVEVELPDRAARLAFLRRNLARRQLAEVGDEALGRVAVQSVGLSLAELERMLHLAAVTAAQRGGTLSDQVLEEACDRISHGEARGARDEAALLRTARHESGHALIAWLGGTPVAQVSIVGRGGSSGRMVRQVDEDKGSYSRAELEQMIAEAMAGRAAEIMCYGPEDGLTTGASADLQTATRLALRMVCEFGMDGRVGQVALPTGQPPGPRHLRAAEGVVSRQLERARERLAVNRGKFDGLVAGLMEKNRLTDTELAALLN